MAKKVLFINQEIVNIIEDKPQPDPIHERQEFGYTKTLLRKQRTSVIFYNMDKNERIYNEQGMPAETKKNHSADADRVKEVYKVTIAGSIINVVLPLLRSILLSWRRRVRTFRLLLRRRASSSRLHLYVAE